MATPLGVVTQRQLLDSGLAPHDIARLVRRGELHRVWRGVFVVGDRPEGDEAVWRQGCAIAVAACGPEAALSGAAAAVFWGWDGFETGYQPTVDTPLGRRRTHPAARRRAGIGDHVERDGVRLTSAAQTLVGLAEGLTRRQVVSWAGRPGQWLSVADQVELALETALRRGEVVEQELLDLVAACAPSRRGQAVLAEVLRRRPPGQPATESYLETRCVQVLRNAGLPTGERQVAIYDGRQRFIGRIDLRVAERVLIEVDGRAFHGADRFGADRRRWTRLNGLGYRLAVFDHDQVEYEPNFVTNQVRVLLDQP